MYPVSQALYFDFKPGLGQVCSKSCTETILVVYSDPCSTVLVDTSSWVMDRHHPISAKVLERLLGRCFEFVD